MRKKRKLRCNIKHLLQKWHELDGGKNVYSSLQRRAMCPFSVDIWSQIVSLDVSNQLFFDLSHKLLGYKRAWYDWVWLWMWSLPLQASLLPCISAPGSGFEGEKGGSTTELILKQKTWLGTQSVLLCNNWPTNIHWKTEREAQREMETEVARERDKTRNTVNTLKYTCTNRRDTVLEVCVCEGNRPAEYHRGIGLYHFV